MMYVALILRDVTHLLAKIRRTDSLSVEILTETDRLMLQIGKLGNEIVSELADSGHCKIFLDCGHHDFSWDCRIKRGGICPFNHVERGKK